FVNIPSITELEWNLRHICSEDLIIIISFSGENQELINLVNQLIIRNISICSITPLRQNTLSSLADFKLYYEYSELNFNDKVDSDYNLFVTLYLVTDALFRSYLDIING
uniref:SIS domain-containing protein n=1 Tax=Eremococcus coleocola TaxID=88132 RepID=UPI00048A2560